ncbi:FecR domain-containing protein [uncultured Draconibacterium sp.]|uniref:FecR family protein n=1 Tax=uncultured Draconibacterium sp. TaxID=1573823 RepID=UPI003217D370
MKNLKDIVNYITGNPYSANKEKLIREVKTDDEQKAFFKKLKIAWALFSSTREVSEYDIEKSYEDLKKKIDREESKYGRFTVGRIFQYAAIVLAVVSLSVFLYLNQEQTPSETIKELQYTSVIAENGQVAKIVLPDSSIVWLNSGTTLSYNSDYAISNRDLNLEGQAYFSVTRNENIPLTVACDAVKVKVLGTKFDVDAYPGKDEINVVLESGQVELLRTEDESFSLKMTPGERAKFSMESKQFVIDQINTEDLTNWKEGYLIFTDSPMSEVIEKLERKFDVDIVVKNQNVNKSLFNARFKDENLNEILEFIEYSCSIKYKVIKNEELNKSIIEFY